MIDVIREKKSKDERSPNQIKASLETDFGEMRLRERKTTILTETWSDQTTLLSSSMKRIRKSNRNEIEMLLQKFLDSYITSTLFDTEENLTQMLLQGLQERYHLTTFPYQIECIDISHLAGSYISG